MASTPPESSAAHEHLQQAMKLRSQKRNGEALAAIKQALALDPALPEAWDFAAHLLVSHKKWAEARQVLTMALQAFPDRAQLLSLNALALAKTGDLIEGYEQVTRALELMPDYAAALLTRIEILCDLRRYDEALQDSEKLPRDTLPETTAFCQGSLNFLIGDRARGMSLIASVIKSGWRGKALPEWDGRPTTAHVVLYNAQAFGDLLQFSRVILKARKLAAKLSLIVPRSMEQLMRDSFPDLPLLLDEMNIPDDISLRCSLPSLLTMPDGAFDPLAETVPYLRAHADLAAAWRARLAHLPRPHIGIAWTSPWQMNNPSRVVDFGMLKPLLDVAAQHLVSLQMGAEAKQAAAASLFDVSPFISSFADSAALVSSLDLLITLDSAPAHLAGALGKPGWVFLPFNAEWRWLSTGEDCLWYPTLRLFRQTQPQGWGEVFGRMASQLQEFILK